MKQLLDAMTAKFKPGDSVKTPMGVGKILAAGCWCDVPEYFVCCIDPFDRAVTEWWREDQVEKV